MHGGKNSPKGKCGRPRKKHWMINELGCCDEDVYPIGTSALYRPGNDVVCIFENPEDDELSRKMPVVGQTGAHWGLLMYLCSAKKSLRRIGFDVSNVTLVNARRKKNIKPEIAYVRFMSDALQFKKVIICFGRSAESLLKDMIEVSLNINVMCVVRTVHLAHNGLNVIKRRDGESASDVQKIGAIADFLSSIEVVAGRDYGDKEFNDCLADWKIERRRIKANC